MFYFCSLWILLFFVVILRFFHFNISKSVNSSLSHSVALANHSASLLPSSSDWSPHLLKLQVHAIDQSDRDFLPAAVFDWLADFPRASGWSFGIICFVRRGKRLTRGWDRLRPGFWLSSPAKNPRLGSSYSRILIDFNCSLSEAGIVFFYGEERLPSATRPRLGSSSSLAIISCQSNIPETLHMYSRLGSSSSMVKNV